MNGILVMADLLAASGLPHRAQRHAEVIAQSGNSLLAIINDVLDLSKIEAGHLDVEIAEIDATTTAETVLRLFSERAFAKGVDLAAEVRAPKGLRVKADPVRLGQVLNNLVNNALKFTETGSVALVVEHVATEPHRLQFRIEDTGIGIPADKLGTIFEAFSQAEASTTRRFGGTGLGLSIARRLVVAMGGELRAASTTGEGSTFSFSLPVAEGSAHGAWPRLTDDAMSKAVLSLGGERTTAAAAAMLRAAGYAVEVCTPGDLAAASRGAALVLADLGTLSGSTRLPVVPGGAILALARLGEGGEAALANRRADRVLERPLLHSELSEVVSLLIEGLPVGSERRPRAGARTPRFQAARVLVADDTAVNREVAIEALGRLGVSVDCVENGRQAIVAVAASTYDLVLMDFSMPEVDGLEATRAIRASEVASGGPRVPIVGLTARVIGQGPDQCRAAGMNGLLHKPYTLAQLAECLAEYLPLADAETAPVPLAAPAPEPEADAPLDQKIIGELLAMASRNPVFLTRVVALYVRHAPETLDQLEAAAGRGDLEETGRLAHALKSMSYNIGAREIAEAAAEIERSARADGSIADPARLPDIRTTLRTTCDALRRLAA